MSLINYNTVHIILFLNFQCKGNSIFMMDFLNEQENRYYDALNQHFLLFLQHGIIFYSSLFQNT